MSPPRLRVGVLLSGSGRTLQNFMELARNDQLPVDLRLVISSRSGVKGIERAEQAGITTRILRPKDHASPRDYGNALAAELRVHQVELVVMAGFLSLWEIPDEFEGRVMNIHPALLPAFGGRGFYGDRVHQAVLDAKVPTTGCTVHFADNTYDTGPVILQRTIEVLPADDVHTLADRVFAEECIAYPQAIRWFAQGSLEICNGQVQVHDGESNAG